MTYNNTFMRNLYSPGFSFIMMSLYRTGLTLGFTPWVGRNQIGRSEYDKSRFLSATIDHEKAAALWMCAESIIKGTNANPSLLILECNKQTMLKFEYNQNQNGQMRASLVIEKNGKQIPFEFSVLEYKTKENGKVVVKEIQVGLGVFMKALEAYLRAIGADNHLNKLTDEELGDPLATSWM